MHPDNKRITKADAIRIVVKCAKEYRDSLEPYSYLFIYRDITTKQIEWFEVRFYDRNYMHLTGLISKNTAESQNAISFYQDCLDERIKEENIEFKADGSTTEKLLILPNLVKMLCSAQMTVVYNNGRPWLRCDRLTGSVNFCLAIKQVSGYYIPVSCINGDIRDMGEKPSRILAIFSKPRSDSGKYKRIRRVTSGINLTELEIPDQLHNMVDLSGYRDSKQ